MAGGIAGNVAGRAIGRREAAADTVKSRRALLQSNALAELRADIQELQDRTAARDFETIDDATARKPIPVLPNRLPRRPSVRGRKSEPGNGVSAESEFFRLRQELTEDYGWAITSALDDAELSVEACEALRNQILSKMGTVNGPRAGGERNPEFEREVLSQHLGARAVSEMPDSLVHCHFLSAQRRGLIELDGGEATTDFAILDRERTAQGTFAPEGQVTDQSVSRAYSRNPRERRTGVSTAAGAASAGVGIASAIAHLRGRKGKRPRLTGGSPPALPGAIGADFAARDADSHPVRDTLAGVGAGALGVAGLLALRKRRQLRLAPGIPKLPPKTIDVDSTTFGMGHPGSYVIRRRTLRGKKPPTHVRPVSVGKAKKHALAFLIQDDDFPVVPMKQPKLAPGMRQRVPVPKSRAEVLRRLRAMTQLSIGSAVAEGAVDALGIGEATTPKRKKLMVDANGNVINPKFLPTPDTTSQSSFAGAIARLHEFGFGSAIKSPVARDIAVIGAADLGASQINDAINRARARRRARLQVRGGIEATPGMNGAPTTMSSVDSTLTEFDADGARDRARKRAGELGAAGVGGIAGAVGGLKYDQGSPVAHSDLKPGDRVYRRFGPGGLFQHAGIVGQDGKITHRTRGSATYRAIKPDSFAKTGKSPTYRESTSSDLPRGKAARNASKAANTRAGKYCVGTNNCQTAVERIASKGRPVSGQLRRAGIGAAIGALGGATVASILNRRKDQNGNR